MQPGQDDHDEPADGGIGAQVAGGSDGVETVGGELVERHVPSDRPRARSLAQQVSNEDHELLMGSVDVLTPMEHGRRVVVAMLVQDERISLEYRLELFASAITSLIPSFDEVLEVNFDLAFMPGDQDRFDVREILVKRRAPDAGSFGDLRHRQGAQATLGYQGGGAAQDRIAYLTAMSLDRVVPKFRHRPRIRGAQGRDTWLTQRHYVS